MKAYRIAAVVAEFNYEVTMLMLERAKAEAEFLGVEINYVVKVPGVFDMPIVIKKLLARDDVRTVTPYTVEAKALNNKTQNSVGLRTSPNKTAKMIRRLAAGDQLQVIAVGKTWSKVIDLATGKTGYDANDYMIRL